MQERNGERKARGKIDAIAREQTQEFNITVLRWVFANFLEGINVRNVVVIGKWVNRFNCCCNCLNNIIHWNISFLSQFQISQILHAVWPEIIPLSDKNNRYLSILLFIVDENTMVSIIHYILNSLLLIQ